jgi:hypothetical protein
MMLGAHLLVCRMSPKQVWRQPSCFLSVMWRGEAFHILRVQDVKVLILPAALFLPNVAQCLREVLESQRSRCLLLHPHRHLGFLSFFNLLINSFPLRRVKKSPLFLHFDKQIYGSFETF